MSVAIAGLASLSCGGSHAILQITAPSTVVAGVPFSATVTAMYDGKVDTIIDGPIHFTTSDEAPIFRRSMYSPRPMPASTPLPASPS